MDTELNELRAKVSALKESMAQFHINAGLPYAALLEKLTALQARLNSLLLAVDGARGEWTVEPYACMSEAERIPNVYLRTRTLPDIEQAEAKLLDDAFNTADGSITSRSVQEKVDTWMKSAEAIGEWLDGPAQEFRFNQRYTFDDIAAAEGDSETPQSPRTTRHMKLRVADLDQYQAQGDLLLSRTLSYISTGTIPSQTSQ